MSKELADALRAYADKIERGDVPDACECVVVVGNVAGACRSTYIGRKVPTRDAGIFLLASGVQRFIAGMQSDAPMPSVGVTRGSTH